MNVTAYPFFALFNATDLEFLTRFSHVINATSWTNLQPQNLHERAEVILSQPETILILVLSILALLVNTLSICATSRIPHGLTTHSKLTISLALSDILITLSVFFHILNKVFNSAKLPPLLDPNDRLTSSCMFALINGLNIMAHLISLLNLLAMAMDHYIAVIWPLHYTAILSRGRGNLLITFLWILAFLGGFCNFLTGINAYKDRARYLNYCEVIMYNDFHGEYLIILVTFVILVSISFIYLRIYCEVRMINNRLTYLQKDIYHNKKSLVTTLLIIGTFIICWVPTCVFQVAMVIQIHVDKEIVQKLFSTLLSANKYLYALLLLNSVCDPIIYALRLRYVQIGYYRLLSRCFKCYAIKIKEEWDRCYIERQNTRRGSSRLDIETGDLSDECKPVDELIVNTRRGSSRVDIETGDLSDECKPVDELIVNTGNNEQDLEMVEISSGSRFLNGKLEDEEHI